MWKVLFSFVAGLSVILAATATGAQESGRGYPRGQPPEGRGPGRGMGQGAKQGLGPGAMPQRGQGQGQYQGDMFTLIQNPAVQRELKTTPQQLEQLRALGTTETAQQAAQMLAERGSCEKTDQRRAVMADVRDEIRHILDDAQWARLNEIWVQVRGVRALQSERIAQQLELSAQQRRQITQLLAGGFRGRAAQLEAQALAVLDKAQQKRFAHMQGAPFALAERPAGGGQRQGLAGDRGPARD